MPTVSGNWKILGIAFDSRLTIIVLYSAFAFVFRSYHYDVFFKLLCAIGLDEFAKTHLSTPLLQSIHLEFCLFLFGPLAIQKFLFKESILEHFGFGKAKEGILWTLGLALPILLILYLTVPDSPIGLFYKRLYYGNDEVNLLKHMKMIYVCFIQLFGWEYILRGFILFGAARVIGPGPAILMQALPFTTLHIGKPELEVFSTLLTGPLFGIIAYRTNTFLYIFFIHMIILAGANLLSVS